MVVAFGGDGTVNEAANGLAGTDTPLTCLPGGSNNVFCKMLGIPNDVVDATEHLLGLPDRWEPRAGRPRARQRPRVHVRGRHGPRRERRRARRPAPGHEAPLRRAGTSPRRRSGRSCAATSSARRASPSRSTATSAIGGVSAFFQNGQPYTYFKDAPDQPHRGRAAGLGRPRAAWCSPAPTRSTCRPCWSARCLQRRCPPPPRRRRSRAPTRSSIRSADGRPSRGRSTATTWPTTTRCASRVEPGALDVVA